MIVHYTHPYILNPVHAISVDLVGIGGTGSQVLTGLARLNSALNALGHPGLHVRAWDPDTVTESNMGRQLFSPADLGENKARILISRVNRYFGTAWDCEPREYDLTAQSNILITCLDSAKARVKIAGKIAKAQRNQEPVNTKIYWLDLGNLQKTGQVVLGTVFPVPQPKSEYRRKLVLPHVVKTFPQIKSIKEKDQGPSCSLAEALDKQDLFINSTLAQFGCNLLWKLFRDKMIKYRGCYVNLETMAVNPIKI